mmetsp:Transcript_33681/g.82633  ORF Transcript_33681/g.82633 Transcript_33681/m.82633 type:complete len:224 (-) Transcript_33681:469-1140(-)
MASSCLSSAIWRSYLRTNTLGSLDSLITALVVSVRTRPAKRHVLTVSSTCESSGHTHAIITVLQLPPSASRSTPVSLLARNGTCASWRLSAFTVCSRKVRLLLMYVASFSACPVTAVFLVRSDPARSTRFSLLTVVLSAPSPLARLSRYTVNTQWLRDDVLFRMWLAVARLPSPAKKNDNASASLLQYFLVRFFTLVCPSRSTMVRLSAAATSSDSRSYMDSL